MVESQKASKIGTSVIIVRCTAFTQTKFREYCRTEGQSSHRLNVAVKLARVGEQLAVGYQTRGLSCKQYLQTECTKRVQRLAH